jgi:hypothetical protein
MKKFGLLILIHIFNLGFSQKTVNIKGQILNANKMAIPYASVFTKKSYGAIADISGKFNLNVNDNETINISAIGFKRKSFRSNINNDSLIIVLDSAQYELNELIVHREGKLEKFSNKKRITKHTYILTTNFWHGTVYEDNILKDKFIQKIKVKAGFIGKPVLPMRLGIFSLDLNGFPDRNLLKKEVIFFPKNSFEWIELDLRDQNILVFNNKIGIALELINPSNNIKKLDKNYSPIIGVSKNTNGIFQTNKLNKWVKIGKVSPVFEMELL